MQVREAGLSTYSCCQATRVSPTKLNSCIILIFEMRNVAPSVYRQRLVVEGIYAKKIAAEQLQSFLITLSNIVVKPVSLAFFKLDAIISTSKEKF